MCAPNLGRPSAPLPLPSRRLAHLLAALLTPAALALPAPVSAQTNPLPSLASLSPASAYSGGADVNLGLIGSGFVSGAEVTFEGAPLQVQFVSATRLNAIIPAASIAAVGSFQVVVTNPAPGGGSSPARVFAVVAGNAVPSLSSISPTVIGVGSQAGNV